MNYEWVSAWNWGQCQGAALWGMRGSAWTEGGSNRAKLVEVVGTDVGATATAVGHAAQRPAQRGASMIETLSSSRFVDQVMRRSWFVPYVSRHSS